MMNNIFLFAGFVLSASLCTAQSFSIKNNRQLHAVTFGNSKIKFVLSYDHQCRVSGMEVNGQKVIEGRAGIYSALQTADSSFSTLRLAFSPTVRVSGNIVDVTGIIYGNNKAPIHESWKFLVSDTGIKFTISRKCAKAFESRIRFFSCY